jgi:uncharacterized protein YjiS (DUF1127 family)
MTCNHQGRSTPQHIASSALSPGHLIENCLRILNYWSERARSRQALAELDERLLRDVGLTPAQAKRESSMAFWQPFKRPDSNEPAKIPVPRA